jgi:hypothetical protein
VTPEGQISGTSVGGVRYEGQFSQDSQTGQPSAVRRFVLPDGEIRDLTTPVSGPPLGRYRVIVQGDMSLRGADISLGSTALANFGGNPATVQKFYRACRTLQGIGRGPGHVAVHCL